ncbi:E3 ubiquitin-protein ligase sina, partial [Eumeta japonica]
MPSFMPVEPTKTSQFQTNATVAGQQLSNSCPPGRNCQRFGIALQSEAMPDLDDLLQCPVCYEIPTGQILQCNEGHHVCGRCKARLDLCPVCRSLFFGTRNYALEELIANVRKLQAFKLGGKMTVTSVSGGSESTASAENSVVGGTLDGSVNEGSNEDVSV